MAYTTIDDNRLYKVTTSGGKLQHKIMGYICPHCHRFYKADNKYEEWIVDATEHATYCSPAFKRAEAGERL